MRRHAGHLLGADAGDQVIRRERLTQRPAAQEAHGAPGVVVPELIEELRLDLLEVGPVALELREHLVVGVETLQVGIGLLDRREELAAADGGVSA